MGSVVFICKEESPIYDITSTAEIYVIADRNATEYSGNI